MATPADGPAPAKRDRHEVLVTVLLVIAAVATAWSSYEAARWHGEQAVATSATNAARIDAARQNGLANADTQVDVQTFIAWVDAHESGKRDVETFYVERFRPEFATAFAAWIATDPLTDATAPKTPFAMPEYQVAAKAEADALDRKAEASAEEARADIQRASNYVLTVVLYAVVMFFAGMSTKLASPRIRMVMLGCGAIVLVSTLAWLATFPVSMSV